MLRRNRYLSALVLGAVQITARPLEAALRLRSPNSTCSIEPVLAQNFPDPTLIELDGLWYAFATSGNGYNVQAAASWSALWPDWQLQTSIPDPLPDPGPWTAAEPSVWAPDIIQLENGNFVLYYAAASIYDPSRHCVGAATSSTLLGPYRPLEQPLACPLSIGGAIDPAGFVDPQSGLRYVVYKVDGNSLDPQTAPCGAPGPDGYNPTPIMLQQVDLTDGTTLISDPVEILDRGTYDGPLVEAPNLFYHSESGYYILTFSSNCYSTQWYDIGYAYSKTLNSTFMKADAPLLTTATGPVLSPGGLCTTPDGTIGVFHGTVGNSSEDLTRYMYAMEIAVNGNQLEIARFL